MTATKKPTVIVHVTQCSHCQHEAYGFFPATGECPRCGRPESQRFSRVISDPHPDTVARARYESQ